tara:strand:- start:936 stop:1595 length:660 start_codon:yes stop_codon:yes gene_type:complete
MTKSNVAAHKRSGERLSTTSRQLRRKENDVWRIARKAPMFLKRSFEVKEVVTKQGKTREKTGKVVYKRSQRLINSHAYLVLMSGAANYAASVVKATAATFRENVQDENRSPWLPGISPGAAAVLEQFLCAYTQEATYKATQVRKSLGTSKRLSDKLMSLGFDAANEAIFDAASLAPRAIAMAPALRVVKGKVAKDETYEPPADEEGEEEEEAPPEADEE